MTEETKAFVREQIEGLAVMVKSGFDEVEKKVDQLRTETTDRSNKVDGPLRHPDNRPDTFGTHERRIKRLEREAGLPTVD